MCASVYLFPFAIVTAVKIFYVLISTMVLITSLPMYEVTYRFLRNVVDLGFPCVILTKGGVYASVFFRLLRFGDLEMIEFFKTFFMISIIVIFFLVALTGCFGMPYSVIAFDTLFAKLCGFVLSFFMFVFGITVCCQILK